MTAQDKGWGPGWPNCQRSRIVDLFVHGVDFPGGVREEAKPVLIWVADQFHRRIEYLHEGWCWGFSCRAIGGTRVPSNHSWGLAIDINAPNHPQGVRHTFDNGQRNWCRKIARAAGCRWGGDYSTTVDEMHFEFMGTPSEARHLANKLDLTQTIETVGETMLNRHDSGQAVKQWQQALMAWDKNALSKGGADGDYGDETVNWTAKFQEQNRLPVGMVTPIEWTVMALELYKKDDPATAPVNSGGKASDDDRNIMEFVRKIRADLA